MTASVPAITARSGRASAPPIHRARLARLIARARDARLAVVIAPGGYGKTTLLREWAQRDARPRVWLTLTAADNDPAFLAYSIAQRLDALDPLPPGILAGLAADDDELPPAALTRLARALAGRTPVLALLDEVDAVHRPQALAVVEAVVEHLGPGSLVVAASRREPRIALGRLRAAGTVVEIRREDLRMTDQESHRMLRRLGLRAAESELAPLVARAEGWPAGLRLAAAALRGAGDLPAGAARFAGDDRVVADYLDDLLAGLPARRRRFLLRSAPLQTLTGPLCDAVLGGSGAAGELRALARANVVLEAVDRSEQRFRHQALLGDALRARLHREDPGWEAEAHRRASAWHEAQGELVPAVDQAIAGRAWDSAGRLVWSAAGSLSGERIAMVERWLDRTAERDVAAQPALAVSAAVACLCADDVEGVERWTSAAEHALGGLAEQPSEPAVGAAALRALIGHGGPAQMAAAAHRLAHLRPRDSRWHPVACLLGGTARLLAGEPASARRVLHDGARPTLQGTTGIQVLCLAQLALLALEEDDVAEGADLALRARDQAERLALAARPAFAVVDAAAAFALSQLGEADRSRAAIAAARRRLRVPAAGVPWLGAEARIALARAQLRLSDAADARALLAEASRALRRLQEAPLLKRWIDDTWERADTFAAETISGSSALTTAELRVLRFLPSHLSFREIALRLHVSSNTVKTQAHAVYRKLDASSRSETVARARAIGLVDL